MGETRRHCGGRVEKKKKKREEEEGRGKRNGVL